MLVSCFPRHRSRPLPRCVRQVRDRKSTRLNSSHLVISYAVFCLKKKTIDSDETELYPRPLPPCQGVLSVGEKAPPTRAERTTTALPPCDLARTGHTVRPSLRDL